MVYLQKKKNIININSLEIIFKFWIIINVTLKISLKAYYFSNFYNYFSFQIIGLSF